MKFKFQKDLPLGLTFLCIFYIINSSLFLISSLIFSGYINIIIFGKAIPCETANFIRLVLIIIPLYLMIGLPFLRKDVYFFTLAYHLFFVINGGLTIFSFQNPTAGLGPILKIVLKSEYERENLYNMFVVPLHTYLIQISSVTIGLFIILYLLQKRKYFKF